MVTPGERLSRRLIAVCIAAPLAIACGEDEPATPDPVPSAAQVRDFWGLGPDSCWRYRRPSSAGGLSTFANVTVKPPNTQVIAGKTVYIRSYRPDSSGAPTLEQYFDSEGAPNLVLARSIDGVGMDRVVKTYDASPPLFGRFEFGEANAIEFHARTFETDSTPKDGTAENHKWVVFDPESVATHDGMADAIKLSYTTGGKTANFFLVPGYGFAKFTDFDGVPHQVCAARVCNDAGVCTGVASCNSQDLLCQ